jgi:hypothetical protein
MLRAEHFQLLGMQAAPSASLNSDKEESFGVGHQDKAAHTGDAIPGTDAYNPAPHPSKLQAEKGDDYMMKHPVYTQEYVESIKPFHRPPQGVRAQLAERPSTATCGGAALILSALSGGAASDYALLLYKAAHTAPQVRFAAARCCPLGMHSTRCHYTSSLRSASQSQADEEYGTWHTYGAPHARRS